MQLKDVIGHSILKQELVNLYEHKRVPHASLFLAKQGWGGLPMALAFSQFLMCEDKQVDDACGQCPSCIQIAKLEHPDVRFSFPTVSPKPGAKNLSNNYLSDFRMFVRQQPYGTTFDWLQFINVENKQGNISADEARSIVDSMTLKSYQGGYKIHIIWRPELLGKEGNILLKLIEEPSPGTFLILVAEEEDKIIATILSRMQVVKVGPIAQDAIVDALESRYEVAADKAKQIALAAEGSYSEALRLKDNWDNDMLPIITQWLNVTYANNGTGIIDWVDEQAKMGREELKNMLQYMQQIFAAALRLNYCPTLPIALPEKDIVLVQKLANMNLPLDIYREIEQYLTEVVYSISRNVNQKIQLLNLSIQMQYWIKSRQLTLSY